MNANLNYSHAIYYQKRGLHKAKLGDHKGAIEDFNYALILDPEDPIAYHERGVSKHAIGNQEGAFQDYMSSIQFQQLQAKRLVFAGSLLD